MNKITFLIGALAFAITSNAQNFYNFSQSTSTYTDLDQPINMTFSENWTSGYYGPIALPFNFSVFGVPHSQFSFESGIFYLTDDQVNTTVTLSIFEYYLKDRNFDDIDQESLSPVSYQIVGNTGNRIFKLEVKNGGLESDEDSEVSTHFVNFQIWLYESDSAIEYHFGPHNITTLETLNEDGEFYPYFSLLSFATNDLVYKRGSISGSAATSVYTEANDDEDDLVSMSEVTAPNTVYRFSINTLSNHDKEKVEFAMYPNPTSDVLNLTFAENLDKNYSVYDLLGREVLNGKFENTSEAQISVENLQTGTYILRIGGTNKKFIKK